MPAMHKRGAFVTPITLVRGISLLELLVVLAILGIMAGLALPSFEGMVRRWRTQAAADSLVSAIYLARNEAARYGGVQMVSRNEPGCQRATGQWQCGWQIQTLGAKPQVLQMAEANRRVRITRSPANNVMGFNQFGQLNGLGAYSFVVEHVGDLGDGSKAITICASSAGRLRTVRNRNSCN